MNSFYNDFLNVDKENTILIPMIQRDYVQGGANDIIESFLTELFSCISSANEKKIDLNYIYGYHYSNEDDSLVLIDGQQRFITLWLFHIYLVKRKLITVKKFPRLKFESREYTDSFVRELYLRKFNDDDGYDLENQKWFILEWKKDISVRNMINAWKLIDKKGKDIEKVVKEKLSNITYNFTDIREPGLTQDLYLKMNGRGKNLSYFDNLKSFMDSNIISIENKTILKDWQYKMDNDWTNLFWKNRNKNQSNSEDISDEQTRLFYNLLYLYWITIDCNQKDSLAATLEKNGLDTELLLLDFNIKITDSKKQFEQIADEILNRIRLLEKPIPLFWIEKLHLFNKDVYTFISNAMDKLISLETSINSLNDENVELPVNLFLTEKESDKKKGTKILYKIAMRDASFVQSLPYLYALINVPTCVLSEKCNDLNFHRYMRLIRNLVHNTDGINFNKIKTILKNIKTISIATSHCNDNFYENFEIENFELNISNDRLFKDNLKGFDETQIQEEKTKLNKLLNEYNQKTSFEEWERNIFKAEQKYFIQGAISFLYLKDSNKNIESVDWDNFDKKYENFKKYFDSDGISKECIPEKLIDSEEKQIHYRELIMTIFLKKWMFSDKESVFSADGDMWRKILSNTKYAEIIHSILTRDLLELNKEEPSYNPKLWDYWKAAEKHFKSLLIDDNFYFVKTVIDSKRLPKARIKSTHGYICFFKEGTSKGQIIFGNMERDSTIKQLMKDKKIDLDCDCFKRAQYYVEKYPDDNEKIFFYSWNREIYFNKIYTWAPNNKIYKIVSGQKKQCISIDELKKDLY